jgi:pyrroloquinoline quinone biosynthesis protein B
VSADGARWLLVNASPDVREQLTQIPRASPAKGVMRDVPVEGVILTDAELDHSIGLLLMREGRALTVHATAGTAEVLERDSRILPTVRAFAAVSVVPLPIDQELTVRDRAGNDVGLTIEAFAVSGDAPRFAASGASGLSVGLMVRDGAGAVAAYIPGCGAIDAPVRKRLSRADAVLFDGTFWSDDEMIALGISSSRGRDMGHVPIAGIDGSLSVLAGLQARVRIYTHINNTNPILIEDSPERRAVDGAGVTVGVDGMMVEL